MVIALMTTFDPAAADGFDATYELRLDGQRSRARVAGGRFEVARGEDPEPDATIETDPGTLAAMLWHGRSLADVLRSREVEIDGSRPAVTRFLRLFRLPERDDR
jgi:ubiquinone biosynthesis protein UbiJ